MDFLANEDRNGVRYSWNVWPSSRVEANRLVVPLGTMYAPLKKIEGMPVLPYEPITCKGTCQAVLNPYCSIDFRAKIWVCPFCYQRNQFPHHYSEMTETNLPAELIPHYSTVEYVLNRVPPVPPIYLFVVDTTMEEQELQALKDTLILSLSLLPERALVGLITFGTNVYVHELTSSDIPKSYVFRGTKEASIQQIQEMLGLGPQPGRPAGMNVPNPQMNGGAARFISPLSECEINITTILEEMQLDPWPIPADHRATRCTGAAVSVAVSLVEAAFPNTGARIMVFMGGPGTEGPGMVVGRELREVVRSHSDIHKGTAKHHSKACKLYEALAKRAAANGHTVDVIGCALDQVGNAEMRFFAQETGGCIVMTEQFDSDTFRNSMRLFFARDENDQHQMGFCATVDVQTTREFKVMGAIGPVFSLNKRTAYVSEQEMGVCGTSSWRLCSLDHRTSVGFYFDVVNPAGTMIPAGQRGLIQYLTQYQHPSGQYRLRVTTVSHRWVETSANIVDLSAGFDQEAAAVLMARIGVFKTQKEDSFDILRWLDRMLIRLVSKFGEYRKDDPNSFRLSAQFSIFPQFMFHLRRSQFLQVFNNSPDESAYFRHVIVRADTTDSLIMIQPTLLSYSFSGPPTPVLLDVQSVAPDRILVLDSFFQVVIFHGETISQWRKLKYQEQPQYENFKLLLQTPKDDAQILIKDRFPVPRYIECDQHGSQARFVMAKLNPSVTHNNLGNGGAADFVISDDVSLQVFMDHLKRLAVQSVQ
eukprot:TRINITY_DN2436_c0_g1_i1.p1 TRINITY_DN2436_c0_g1~~TRINITY_DN2436_c0_g1_i1.p1  ORF type:complete len:759 (-),score=173.69 TRINITY_DN2436_c0_g1_i1:514-2790(-)